MTDVGNAKLLSFLDHYFEKIFQNESEPIKDAIQTSVILSEVRKCANNPKAEKHANKISENVSPNIGNERDEDIIRRLQATHYTKLEEYHRVAVQHVHIQSDMSEIRSEYASACAQLKHQINGADQHRLNSALRVFDMLDSDEKRGGYGRLHSLIEVGITSIEDAVKSLSSKISESRKEYVAIRHSEDLLECCAKASYERVRDSYTNLLRLCRKRSHESDLQWSKLECECREWLLSNMRATHERYAHSKRSADIGSSEGETSPMEKSRIETGRRFQKFSDQYVNVTDQRHKKSMSYLEGMRRSRKAGMHYKQTQGKLLEDWLEMTTREIETCYAESVEELQNRVSAIRLHITGLELHQKKLSHLRKVELKAQSVLQEQKTKFQGDRLPMLRGQSTPLESGRVSVSNSMNLGTRIHELSKHVGVEDDDCVLLLTQLLHTVNPDNAVIHKLNQFVNHYSKRMASRIS